MFVVQTTKHNINNISFCGGESEDAIYQDKFETLDQALYHITHNVIYPNKYNKFNTFSVFLGEDDDLTFSDSSITNWQEMIDCLKIGNKITLQLHYANGSGVFNSQSFQIFDVNKLNMKQKYMLSQNDNINYNETQLLFETKNDAVKCIMSDILNIGKSLHKIKNQSKKMKEPQYYIDIINGEIYLHNIYYDEEITFNYSRCDKLFNFNGKEPSNFDELYQWFYEEKDLTLDWSDSGSINIFISEIYVF